MKAHQLAKLLLKMPNVEVRYSHGDNSQHEVAGWCSSVDLLVKSELDTSDFNDLDMDMYNGLPPRTVVIRG